MLVSVPMKAEALQSFQRVADVVVGHNSVADVVEVVLDLQQPRDRDQPEVGVVRVALGKQVGDRATGRRAAWDREEVVGAEPLGELVGDGVEHVGVGEPGQRIELNVPTGVGNRLERDRADSRVRDAVADHGADFVFVEVLLDRGDQGDGELGLGAVVQRLLLDVPQVATTDRLVGLDVEAVELEVDVDLVAGAVAPAGSATKRLSEASRMPLVLRLTDLIGLAWARSIICKICLWIVGSPPENISTSGSPSAATNASIIVWHCPRVIE